MKAIRTKVTVVLILILTMVACQTQRFDNAPLKLDQYTLRTEDLSERWKFTGGDRDTDYGGESYTVSYQIDDHDFLSHTISIYPNEGKSQEAYKEWVKEWFNVASEWQTGNYSPLDKKDDYKSYCLRLSPESSIFGCRYLQRHNEIISFVRVGLDSTNMTFEELDKILGLVDERLNSSTGK